MRVRSWIFAALVAAALVAQAYLLSLRIARSAEESLRSRLTQASSSFRAQVELLDARLSPRAIAAAPELADALRPPPDAAAAPVRPDEKALRAAAAAAASEPDLLVVATARGGVVSRRGKAAQAVDDVGSLPLVKAALEGPSSPSFIPYDGALYRVSAARVPAGGAVVVAGMLVDDRLAAQWRSQVDAEVSLLNAGGTVVASSLAAGDLRTQVAKWAKAPAPGFGALTVRLPFVGTPVQGQLPKGTSRWAVRGALVPIDSGVRAALTLSTSPYLAWLGRYQVLTAAALLLFLLFSLVWGLLQPAGEEHRDWKDLARPGTAASPSGPPRKRTANVATPPPALDAGGPALAPVGRTSSRNLPWSSGDDTGPHARVAAAPVVTRPDPLDPEVLPAGDDKAVGLMATPASGFGLNAAAASGPRADAVTPPGGTPVPSAVAAEGAAGEPGRHAPVETAPSPWDEPAPSAHGSEAAYGGDAAWAAGPGAAGEVEPEPTLLTDRVLEADAPDPATVRTLPDGLELQSTPAPAADAFSFAGLMDDGSGGPPRRAPAAAEIPAPAQQETEAAAAEPFPGDEPTRIEPISAALLDKLRERDLHAAGGVHHGFAFGDEPVKGTAQPPPPPAPSLPPPADVERTDKFAAISLDGSRSPAGDTLRDFQPPWREASETSEVSAEGEQAEQAAADQHPGSDAHAEGQEPAAHGYEHEQAAQDEEQAAPGEADAEHPASDDGAAEHAHAGTEHGYAATEHEHAAPEHEHEHAAPEHEHEHEHAAPEHEHAAAEQEHAAPEHEHEHEHAAAEHAADEQPAQEHAPHESAEAAATKGGEVAPAPDPEQPWVDADETHWRDTYEKFVQLRRQTGEGDRVTYEKFSAKLRKNREDLLAKHNCKGVRFMVYEKDGRAAIKASALR